MLRNMLREHKRRKAWERLQMAQMRFLRVKGEHDLALAMGNFYRQQLARTDPDRDWHRYAELKDRIVECSEDARYESLRKETARQTLDKAHEDHIAACVDAGTLPSCV